MAIEIIVDNGIKPGRPIELFDTGLNVHPDDYQYDVTADGKRFVLLKPLAEVVRIALSFSYLLPYLNRGCISEWLLSEPHLGRSSSDKPRRRRRALLLPVRPPQTWTNR